MKGSKAKLPLEEEIRLRLRRRLDDDDRSAVTLVGRMMTLASVSGAMALSVVTVVIFLKNKDDFSVSGLDNTTEDSPRMSSISRLVLASKCPERLACVAASPGLTNLTSGARSTARQLVTTS